MFAPANSPPDFVNPYFKMEDGIVQVLKNFRQAFTEKFQASTPQTIIFQENFSLKFKS